MLTGNKQKSRGFLLLEIMISISVLSIGILLILNSFVNLIRSIELSKDYFKAGLMLEEKLTEVYNSDIEEGLSGGEFSGFDNRFSWDMNVIESEDGSCKEVSLKVSWRERGKEKDLSVSTCI